jgi:hypothetical protein
VKFSDMVAHSKETAPAAPAPPSNAAGAAGQNSLTVFVCPGCGKKQLHPGGTFCHQTKKRVKWEATEYVPVTTGSEEPSLSVPDGMTFSEFAMREAIKGFRRAGFQTNADEALRERADAIVNLSHAWLCAAVEGGRVPVDEARGLYRDLVNAAGCR